MLRGHTRPGLAPPPAPEKRMPQHPRGARWADHIGCSEGDGAGAPPAGPPPTPTRSSWGRGRCTPARAGRTGRRGAAGPTRHAAAVTSRSPDGAASHGGPHPSLAGEAGEWTGTGTAGSVGAAESGVWGGHCRPRLVVPPGPGVPPTRRTSWPPWPAVGPPAGFSGCDPIVATGTQPGMTSRRRRGPGRAGTLLGCPQPCARRLHPQELPPVPVAPQARACGTLNPSQGRPPGRAPGRPAANRQAAVWRLGPGT